MTERTPLLEVRGVGKKYPGIVALEDINFSGFSGEIHALVGANGAGKSTLMNILSGATQPSTGEIYLDGKRVHFSSPAHAQKSGIATVYQEFSLVPQLSVERNIFLGREPTAKGGFVDLKRMRSEVEHVLNQYGVDLDPSLEVSKLTVAQQQLVEIVRALTFKSRVLILDEPSAVLSLNEQERLFGIMNDLRQRGLLVLYVSHRLEEIIRTSDRMTVLRGGRLIGTYQVEGMAVSDIVKHMIGREIEVRAKPTAVSTKLAEYTVHYSTPRGKSTVQLRSGEVLGIAGLVGAGRSTFGRAIAGVLPPSGTLVIEGLAGRSSFNSPQEAVDAGIVYLTEDRKRDGNFGNLDLVTNAIASSLKSVSSYGLRDTKKERSTASGILMRLKLVARDLSMSIMNLSGGNQQKVLLGRAILARPRVLICDEPTRGVDVGAKAEIHSILCELAREGCAVVAISSEIEELLVISDRIVVMRDYKILREFPNEGVTEHQILEVASSGAEVE